MAYQSTFTNRFQKHYRSLADKEKRQLANRLELMAENPAHPSLRTKRIQGTADLFDMSAASTWISVSFGTTRAIKRLYCLTLGVTIQ